MRKSGWFYLFVLVIVLSVTTGCTEAKQEYTLECDIDTEQYSIMISGEEGPLTTQTHGESTSTEYKDGNLVSITVEVNRTMTFEDSGNSYDIVGEISVNFQTEVVNYEITATGDNFEEPQTCKK